jgi:hypothetical protein
MQEALSQPPNVMSWKIPKASSKQTSEQVMGMLSIFL